MGGALWGSWVMYGVGLWTLLGAAASVYAGVPGNYLVLSLAGGGGFLARRAGAPGASGARRPIASALSCPTA